ncbi:Mov34/MPN/PAD-1 family protein [Actinidia rufa]|uniref:Mov34/MPN/PAD-1 family protein n=1 Tax=Actinidia rufa TaxID=165716 RepID=A0A7J0GB03_9ERIC|nr:Mov34/MPN/PAD-1 family protein [Actinidia rufa]
MSLTSVKMSDDVWLTCLTHALSTETEEIMGLLLGDIQQSKNGSVTALIWGALPQPRSDRQKDRVETNPEQLTAASVQAEISFPHVRTQAMYQLLDSGFIGLIFSCFSEDVHKVGRIQVIAFQSLDGKQNQMLRAVPLSPVNRSAIIDLESSLSSSENASTRLGLARIESLEQDTGDSRATAGAFKGGGRSSDLGGFFANADGSYQGKERMGGNYRIDNLDNSVTDIDPMDMSESMQEAMHRSNLDISFVLGGAYLPTGKNAALNLCREISPISVLKFILSPSYLVESCKVVANLPENRESALLPRKLVGNSPRSRRKLAPISSETRSQQSIADGGYGCLVGAPIGHRWCDGGEFVRKEIPLYVLPTLSLLKLDCPLASFTDLQHVLYEEERTAYNQAILQNMSLSPAINALQDRLRENEIRLAMLTDETKILETEAFKGSDSSLVSPRNVPPHGLRGSASFGHRDLYSPPESVGMRSPGSRSRKGS